MPAEISLGQSILADIDLVDVEACAQSREFPPGGRSIVRSHVVWLAWMKSRRCARRNVTGILPKTPQTSIWPARCIHW